MVSLRDRQALAVTAEADQELKRLQRLLNEEGEIPGCTGDGLHEKLLASIASNETARFNEVASELGERKIKPESDWCQDDYLLFLLLLGKEKFGCTLPFLAQVIEARRKNPNSLPRKINEVFAALYREEFGLDGEFGFLKIPFLHLVGKLRVGPTEAKKAMQSMSVPGLLDQLSPFLKLLTMKAYDLVLLERQPLPTETTAQLIEGFEAHAKDLSLSTWWRVLTALPGRFIWAMILGIVGLGLIPFLFGVGKGLVETFASKEVRVRPEAMTVTDSREPGPELPMEALMLANALPQPVGPGKRSHLISVHASTFDTPTPAFVVEVSHPSKPIRSAFAFVQSHDDGPGVFTIVPVQRDGGRFRALLPPQPQGTTINFVLDIEAEITEDVNTVRQGIVLRSLQ
jgi:hypothetical protein